MRYQLEVEPLKVKIRHIVEGYKNERETGKVVGYNGKLDIRPPYQREFIYEGAKREAVITTIRNKCPLNVMYWGVRDNGDFEVIDGQQRTISICEYVEGNFSYKGVYFQSLEADEKEEFLNYDLMVYTCKGTERDKLNWFETVNIAGEKLSPQEIRNAVYHGSWVTDAKKYFGRESYRAHNIGNKFISKNANRQEYLELAIKWWCAKNSNYKDSMSSRSHDENIKEYMSKNRHKENADDLKEYFEKVIEWIKGVFPSYRKEMRGIEWGFLYNQYKDKEFNSKELAQEVTKLMKDEDVTSRKGIYPYVITRDENYLNIRSFNDTDKRQVYEEQKGICPITKEVFKIEQMEADHIIPWSKGGKTEISNLQMVSKLSNRRKGNRN